MVRVMGCGDGVTVGADVTVGSGVGAPHEIPGAASARVTSNANKRNERSLNGLLRTSDSCRSLGIFA